MSADLSPNELSERLRDLEKKSEEWAKTKKELLDQVKELEAVDFLSRALASSLNLDEVLRVISKHTVTLVGSDLAVVYLVEGDRLVALGTGSQDPDVGGHEPEAVKVGECLCGLVAKEQRAVYSQDIWGDPRCTLEDCKRAGIRSFAALPLEGSSEFLGVLGVGSFEERDFTLQRRLLENLASHAAVALQNVVLHERIKRRAADLDQDMAGLKRAREELREESIFRKAIIDGATEGICVCHEIEEYPYVRFTIWNERMTEITGYTIDDINLMGWYQTVYPDREVQARAIQRMEWMRKGVDLFGEEWEITRADGQKRAVSISTRVLEKGDGKAHVLALMYDITDRKRAEDALRQSEITLDTVFRAAPIGIGLVKDRVLGWTNEQLWEMTGYTAEELNGQSARMLYPSQEEFERVGRVKHPRVLELGRGAIETQFKRKDGRIIDILLSSSSIIPGDLSQGIVFTATDITEQKRSQKELRDKEEKYRLVVENANDAIFIVQDELVKFPNTRALDLIGYSAQELAERPFYSLIHPGDRYVVLERHRRRLKGEKLPATYGFRIVNKRGETIWIQLNTVLIEWEGRPATLNFLRDTTQQMRLETQLQQAHKMEAIGTLAGGVAHDFNNLLTPIIVRTEMALMDLPTGSPLQYHLEEVLKAAERAKDLVRQILTFSRQGEQMKKPLRMSLIVNETLKFLRATLPTTIELRQEIKTEAAVLADPTQIHQVIMNLCTNSAQAMRQGGVMEVKLEEGVAEPELQQRFPDLQVGPYVRISIKDTGRGMEPWLLEKIFDPYFTTKDKGEGTGLGLAVVHGIVKSLDGAITVESELEKGTTFTIYLPRIASMFVPESRDHAAALPGGSETVLLVDDEKIMLETVEEMLTKLGYEVDGRSDPVEALEILRGAPDRYDLVITDQTMPGMTGAELAKEILRIRPGIPIVLCTGYSELITEQIAEDLGIRAFLMKPVAFREMAETLRHVLEEGK